MRSTDTLAGILLLLSIPFTTRAEAQGVAPCAAYWHAEAVFVGRVEAIKRAGAVRVVSFAVLEGFSGVGSSTIDVSTALAGQRCSSPFVIGKRYVVYAERRDGGILTTCRSSGTRAIEDAGADLTYARAIKQGRPSVGSISGRVLIVTRDLAGKPVGGLQPAPDVSLTVTRDALTDTVTTDRAGNFLIENRGAGVYRLGFAVPERYYLDEPSTIVTLRDARSCQHVEAILSDNGQVTGRVVDAAGRAVAGLTIELGPASSDGTRRGVTDRAGRYVLARIPAGRFVLRVPAGPHGADRSSAAQLFHPGVETPRAATRISLAAGQRLDLADLVLPQHRQYIAVSGVVFAPDGAPAEGARVYLKGVGENDRIVSEPVSADFMGRFVIAARAGSDYALFAERPRPGGNGSRLDSADAVRLTAVAGLAPVRLTLARRY